ncbi:unnamed protein product [Toxocara canis]|uniref:Uncharacterized protein n=1 Tax=Toxocara canis TaxID=6265 RepID=A0A183UY10_TOXCA|nr:unnamed protein product [Toxocara canis]
MMKIDKVDDGFWTIFLRRLLCKAIRKQGNKRFVCTGNSLDSFRPIDRPQKLWQIFAAERARELWCLLKELQECAMIKYIILVGSANVNRRASGTESSERANQFAEKTCPAGGGNAIELGVLHPTDEYQSTS